MNDDDFRRRLAFVAPERRHVVEHRLRILRDYERLDRPTTEDSATAAKEIGLTQAGFYRLLSAWRANRDPAALQGVSGGRPDSDALLPDDEGFIRRTFAGMPAGRPLDHDANEMRRIAGQQGVELRGVGSLHRLLLVLRAERAAAAATGPRVVVDHVALEIPITAADDDDPVMPIATVVADVREQRILTVLLDLYTPGATAVAAALSRAARQGAFVPTDGASGIGFDAGPDDSWDRLDRSLGAAGIIRPGARVRNMRGGRRAGGLVVPTMLGIRSRPGIISRHMDNRRMRLRKSGDSALTLAEAQTIVDDRLASERAGDPVPFSRDPSILVLP